MDIRGTLPEEMILESGDRPGLIGGHGVWPRFSQYEATCFGKWRLYIRPAVNARIEWYRPYDYQPRIMLDYLELASSLERIGFGPWSEHDTKNIRRLKYTEHARVLSEEQVQLKVKRIIEFCQKYGLLGLYWERLAHLVGYQYTPYYHPPYYSHPLPLVDREKQKFKDEAWVKAVSVANLFFERMPRQEVLRRATKVLEPDDPKMDEFWRGYSEWVKWIEIDAHNFLQTFKAWSLFFSSSQSPGDNSTYDKNRRHNYSWEKHLQLLSITRPTGITVSYDHNWKVEYIFDSLSSAIRLLFIQNIISREPLKACGECGAPFISQNPRAKYCSVSHEHRARQRRYLDKRKGRRTNKN